VGGVLVVGGRDGAEELVAAAEQVAVAAALGHLEDVIRLEAIDHEVAVEVGAENVMGHAMATGALAGADDVDRGGLAAEDPQPGVESAHAPAGLVGMDDMALAKGFQEQFIRGPGQVGEALLGTDEGTGADLQVAVGLQEVADLAVADAEAVFHLGGHGQDDGAEGIASGADGVGGLLGVPSLPVLAAAGAVAGGDVELGDDGHDRRQVGLVLDDLALVVQGRRTHGAFVEGNVDDAVDLVGRGHGSEVGLVPLATAGPLGMWDSLLSAKRMSLPVLGALILRELLTELVEFGFEF